MPNHPSKLPEPTLFGKILALTIGLVLLVIIAEICTRMIMPHWKNFQSGSFMRLTQVPGHTNVTTGVPGFDDYFAQNNGDFKVRIEINDFGLRNPDPVNKADKRIWVIGDSMTFGWGVEQEQMYSSLLANISGHKTYNIASPGTTVCGYQALVGRMPKNKKPSAVVVGLILENDILRYNCKAQAQENKSNFKLPEAHTFFDFKKFLTHNLALYNFVALSLKKIPLINSTLVYLGLVAEPHTYHQKFRDDELFDATRETVQELSNLKRQFPFGTPFAVLIAPARFEIKDSSPLYQKLRKEIINALDKVDITTIDPIDGFLEYGFSATHFAHDGHWNVLGHQIAATAINNWILTLSK